MSKYYKDLGIMIIDSSADPECTIVSDDMFESIVEIYRKENNIFDNILKHRDGKWGSMPSHLIRDLFIRVGCKPRSYLNKK